MQLKETKSCFEFHSFQVENPCVQMNRMGESEEEEEEEKKNKKQKRLINLYNGLLQAA